MKILEGKEKDYQEWYDTNRDSYYGRGCFTYAVRWAELLEDFIKITNSEPCEVIKYNADRLSYVADTDGITGFMYGCAVNILSECWIYGEYLRKWHNEKYGHEGEGVVNPAVLTIK